MFLIKESFMQSANDMFLKTLEELSRMQDVVVRGSSIKEIIGFSDVADGRKPIVHDPTRNTDIIAQLFEVFWTLGGSSDITRLKWYLPKAPNFSDDGFTWRAGYGPRLVNWHGRVNQYSTIISAFEKDLYTRQAVISLWDPEQDNIKTSKDYPCNNIIQFLYRDDEFHVCVYVRSNDLLWGFSHVDFLCWSLLGQVIGNTIAYNEIPIVVHWNVGSMHYYNRFNDKISNILKNNEFKNIESGIIYPQCHSSITGIEKFYSLLQLAHDMFVTCNGNVEIPLSYVERMLKETTPSWSYERYAVIAVAIKFLLHYRTNGTISSAIVLDELQSMFETIPEPLDIVAVKLLATVGKVIDFTQICWRLNLSKQSIKMIENFM